MKKNLFIFILTVVILGCSSEGTNEEIPIIAKVTDSDQILSIENFKQVGFKKSKKYKVDELPGATSAYYGFIKNKLDPDDQKIDYEIRFYANHSDAKEIGAKYADNATGKKDV